MKMAKRFGGSPPDTLSALNVGDLRRLMAIHVRDFVDGKPNDESYKDWSKEELLNKLRSDGLR
jgi:hypothetical protein